jgi:hypothetical protein
VQDRHRPRSDPGEVLGGVLNTGSGDEPYTGHGDRVGSFAMSVAGGYGFRVSDRWLVGIGAEWFPAHQRPGRDAVDDDADFRPRSLQPLR